MLLRVEARKAAVHLVQASGVIAVRVVGMLAGCEFDDLLPVLDSPPEDDDETIFSEADFDIHALAGELRQWLKKGRSEEGFRELLAENWPAYKEVAFPATKSYVLRDEAEALVELGVAEPVDVGEIEDALEQWNLA